MQLQGLGVLAQIFRTHPLLRQSCLKVSLVDKCWYLMLRLPWGAASPKRNPEALHIVMSKSRALEAKDTARDASYSKKTSLLFQGTFP